MLIFDLTPSSALGKAVAQAAGYPLSKIEMRRFRGGQHKIRPLVSVRGQDVFIVAALHPADGASTNDLLIQFLFFVATCRDHGARRITAVVPWLPYARKDRVTKARDPVSSRYVAQLFDAVGTDAVVTVDVHNPAAFQNGFRCQTVHLQSTRLFASEIAARAGETPIVVMSPDSGGVKRAEVLRQSVEMMLNRPTAFAFMEKHRSQGLISGTLFAGTVTDQDVWIVDDMIDSGETMLRAANACRERGALTVHVLATHALCRVEETACLQDPAIDTITVTDSAMNLGGGAEHGRITTLSLAPMIGQCLARMHHRQAVSPVLDTTGLTR
jgi:ribose-phosphate pyrophosphokinase